MYCVSLIRVCYYIYYAYTQHYGRVTAWAVGEVSAETSATHPERSTRNFENVWELTCCISASEHNLSL